MIDWPSLLFLLAQEEKKPAGDPITPLIIPMVVIAFLWYFLLFRPQKRDKAQREETLKALKKNDRVVTIGGIIGSIANISKDGKDVTLKVDDNTRIKILRSSIQGLYGDDGENDSSR